LFATDIVYEGPEIDSARLSNERWLNRLPNCAAISVESLQQSAREFKKPWRRFRWQCRHNRCLLCLHSRKAPRPYSGAFLLSRDLQVQWPPVL